MYSQVLVWSYINIIFMLVGYKVMNMTIDCCCLCCNKIFILNAKNQLKIGHSDKTNLEKGDTICRVIALSFISLVVTGFFKNWYDVIYLPIILLTIPCFAIIGEIRGLQTSCSNGCRWPILSWIVYILAGLFVLCSLGFNIYTSYNEDYLWYYLGGILSVIGTYIIIYYSFVYNKEDPQFHLHHWLIGYIMSLFMICNNPISKVCFAIYYGIFIEGVTIYSLKSVFE